MTGRILAINPGSTSTKIALYENEVEQWQERIDHSHEELSCRDRIAQGAQGYGVRNADLKEMNR